MNELDMLMACWLLKSPWSLSSTSAHTTMVTLVNIMVMNGWLASFLFHVICLSHSWDKVISDSDLETRRSRSLVCHFLFISHQSDQHFLRYSYFKIWPWNIQGQGHEWGLRSRYHIIRTTQLMHFIFISHQSDQPFLRYGRNKVWPSKNICAIKKTFAKTIIANRTFPKCYQVITMTIAMKLQCFVVIK